MDKKLLDASFGDFTIIKNAVFEHIMPSLSSDGWKVLCVALWQTWASRTQTALDAQRLAQMSGLSDRKAVERAIEECVNAGYLVRRPAGAGAVYALNTEFELRAAEAPVELTPEQAQALIELLEFGQEMAAEADPAQARLAVARNTPEAVRAWIETGGAMTHLKAPERFKTVVARLLDQIPPLPIHVLLPEEEPAPATAEMNAAKLWQAVLEELRPRTKRTLFQWLTPTQGVKLSNGVLTVAASNKRTQEWLESGQLADDIRTAVGAVAGEPLELVFIVGE
jgi:hypothetical protein